MRYIPVDPDGEEDGVHTAFMHASHANVNVGVALAEIGSLGK
jgi:hypothetical protein